MYLIKLASEKNPTNVSDEDVWEIVGLLEDRDISVRTSAAAALGALGHRATSAVPALERALKSEEAGSTSSRRQDLGANVIIRHALERIR